eukprot:6620626-Prymnesium_polylepis.1
MFPKLPTTRPPSLGRAFGSVRAVAGPRNRRDRRRPTDRRRAAAGEEFVFGRFHSVRRFRAPTGYSNSVLMGLRFSIGVQLYSIALGIFASGARLQCACSPTCAPPPSQRPPCTLDAGVCGVCGCVRHLSFWMSVSLLLRDDGRLATASCASSGRRHTRQTCTGCPRTAPLIFPGT